MPHSTPSSRSRRLPLVLALGLAALLSACSSAPLPPWDSGAAPAGSDAGADGSRAPGGNAGRAHTTNSARQQPYRPAVAARFPDPSTSYETPGLARSRYTTAGELALWLNNQARRAQGTGTRLGVIEAGRSQRGAPIQALVATRASSIAAPALARSARPTVLLVAGQRGNAPAGVEALLVIASELAPGGLLELLLERINVVLVPSANPDAQPGASPLTADGTDLTRDHLLLGTPEARALAALVRDYRPVAVVDLQEYPALGRWLPKYQASARHDALLQYGSSANQHEFVTRAARQWYTPALQAALARAGLRQDWYATPNADPQDRALYMGSPAPDALHNASGLKHAVGYLLASRGSDLGRTHIQRRVHTLVTAATQILQTTAERTKDLRQVQTFVEQETAALACRRQLDVQAHQTPEQRSVTLLDAETGTDQRVRVDWHSSLQLQTTTRRARPCGYWLAASAQAAVQRLRLLGLQVFKVAEPGQLVAETWHPGQADAPAYLVTRGALRAAPGSFYLPMNQPLAHLASAALEPDTAHSYFTRSLLAALGNAARVMAPSSVVFEEEGD